MPYELGPRFGYSQKLEQRQVLPYGQFEEQLQNKVEFLNIENPYDSHHGEMLDALLRHYEGEERSLISQIVIDRMLKDKPIDKITIESFEADDVGLDIGTKRHVDRFIIKFEGESDELSMTVSIDKEPVKNLKNSPSLQEASVLGGVEDPEATWSVQNWYGSTHIENRDGDGEHGVVCKEYIPGVMLANFTTDVTSTIDAYGKEDVVKIARAVGKMIANSLEKLKGIPNDSNGLNIIITEGQGDEIRARYCDVEKMLKKKSEIEKEITKIKKELGAILASEFTSSLKEHYDGDLIEFA